MPHKLHLMHQVYHTHQGSLSADAHTLPWLPPHLQAEVEQWYVSQGYLLPAYHKGYWLGLATNASKWPVFTWTSSYAPAAGEAPYVINLVPCLKAGSAVSPVPPSPLTYQLALPCCLTHLDAGVQSTPGCVVPQQAQVPTSRACACQHPACSVQLQQAITHILPPPPCRLPALGPLLPRHHLPTAARAK